MTVLEGLALGAGFVYALAALEWSCLVFEDNSTYFDRDKYPALAIIEAVLTGICWFPIILFAIFSNRNV